MKAQGRPGAAIWIVVIAAIAGGPAVFMYLVTTFLFAFSGGQDRMVAVLNYVALGVVGATVVAAAAVWKLRSPLTATKWAAITTAAGWIAAVILEWRLSFILGAA
jgi:hypothetical protein